MDPNNKKRGYVMPGEDSRYIASGRMWQMRERISPVNMIIKGKKDTPPADTDAPPVDTDASPADTDAAPVTGDVFKVDRIIPFFILISFINYYNSNNDEYMIYIYSLVFILLLIYNILNENIFDIIYNLFK